MAYEMTEAGCNQYVALPTIQYRYAPLFVMASKFSYENLLASRFEEKKIAPPGDIRYSGQST